MDLPDWIRRCSDLLDAREHRSLRRRRKITQPLDAVHVEIDGRRYVNFCSNNYLGLTHHPRLLQALRESRETGSGAAGLISGYTDLHASAEAAIAQWKSFEASLLLPSGYQANCAAIQTLAAIGESYRNGVRFIVDKLAHASLIDAVRMTQSPMRIIPHNGMPKLRRLLEEAEPEQLQVFLTESIFSMDGDAAALVEIARLKQSHSFVLVLDEAHGSGVYGANGAGLAAEMGLGEAVDISIVTLSKALGCVGGAVCSSAIFRDAMLNFARAYIYSTSIPPAIAACASAAIHVLIEEPKRRQRVRQLAQFVRMELSNAKLKIPPGDSPIIAIIVGAPDAALKVAENLFQQGMLVIAVRPPTVPFGASRVRITLSSEHTDQQIEQLLRAIRIVNW